MSSSANETSTSSSTTYERSDSKKSIKVDDLFAKFSFFSSESSPVPSDFSSAISAESSKIHETKSETKTLPEDSSLVQSSVQPQTAIKSNSSLGNESTSSLKNQSKPGNPKPKKTKNQQVEVIADKIAVKTSKKDQSEKQTKKFEREFSTSSGVQGLGRLESKIRVLESTKMKDAYQKKDNKNLQARVPQLFSALRLVHKLWIIIMGSYPLGS